MFLTEVVFLDDSWFFKKRLKIEMVFLDESGLLKTEVVFIDENWLFRKEVLFSLTTIGC